MVVVVVVCVGWGGGGAYDGYIRAKKMWVEN